MLNLKFSGVSGNNNKGDLVPVSKNFSYPYPISQWTQFSILLGRAFLCNRREFVGYMNHIKDVLSS